MLLIVLTVGCCLPDLFAQNPLNTADYGLLNYRVEANVKVFITTDKTLTAEKVTSANFRSNFTELPAVVVDISDNKSLNRNKSIELANLIISNKLD